MRVRHTGIYHCNPWRLKSVHFSFLTWSTGNSRKTGINCKWLGLETRYWYNRESNIITDNETFWVAIYYTFYSFSIRSTRQIKSFYLGTTRSTTPSRSSRYLLSVSSMSITTTEGLSHTSSLPEYPNWMTYCQNNHITSDLFPTVRKKTHLTTKDTYRGITINYNFHIYSVLTDLSRKETLSSYYRRSSSWKRSIFRLSMTWSICEDVTGIHDFIYFKSTNISFLIGKRVSGLNCLPDRLIPNW